MAGLAFVALVVWLSLTPNPVQAPSYLGVKVGHFLAYAWLMFFHAHLHRGRRRLALGIAFALMGVALEFLQGTTTFHRTFAYSDMLDNVLGLFAGYLVFLTPASRILPWIDQALGRMRA